MPRQWGMNPILLKTLIQLAASNKKPAPTGTVGSDAQLKNRIVLFSDEAVNLPDWGISGLPAMILGAAPQTCLFVGDLHVDSPGDDESPPHSDDAETDSSDPPSDGTVSFSLTIKSPPDPASTLQARTIVWKLSLPIAGYRDVQTGAGNTTVRAPVIKSRLKLGGVERDVEIGLLEMGGLEQPLLIGKDTLADKFLIRPDRPDDQKAANPPAVDLNQHVAEAPQSAGTDAKSDDATAKDTSAPSSDSEAEPASSTADDKAHTASVTDAQPDADTSPDQTTAATPENNTTPDTSQQTETADTPTLDQNAANPAPDTPQNKAAPDAASTTADGNDASATPDTPTDTAANAENQTKPDDPSNAQEGAKTSGESTTSQTGSETAKPADRAPEPA
ncbi:hypothetical protein [Thalassospira sp.]|uniref:hypothetical protein n=1 Tax=Thalassospira sp. TaxID=1912094 RepID=UPI001B18536F|nr:hypothetical protein [Thalassospira sp.]MBO6807817.1 hypothetical protein [Thalassospira sp.]MBO6840973.1 hypothetical protein [Thalassospira sp.]